MPSASARWSHGGSSSTRVPRASRKTARVVFFDGVAIERRSLTGSQPMEDQTFFQEYDDVIGAAITLAVTFLVAYVVDRFVLARAGRVADRVSEVGISRAATTRLRVVRRLVFAAIVLIGCFLALSEFTDLDKLATG